MTAGRRKPSRSGQKAGVSRARSATRPNRPAFAPPPEHDPLADSRLRPLVERYARLARAKVTEVGAQLVEIAIPEGDRAHFGGRAKALVAFAVPALDAAPEAEMAVIGSPFVEQLLAAIRARGSRLVVGVLPSAPDVDAEQATLEVPIKNGSAGKPAVRLARHPVGRLLARVLVRAGAAVEEHLVEGGFFDLATGAPLPRATSEHCARFEEGAIEPADAGTVPEARLAPARPPADLMELMVADLRARLAPRVDALRVEAERALAAELGRIDGYYRAMLEDVGAKETDGVAMADAGRAIEAEHARRRVEEERRHQVRAVVHPLQLAEMELLVQRAEWPLESTKGRRATLSAQRFLSGSGEWRLTCPTCAKQPSALVICGEGEIACLSCANECSVCGEGFRGAAEEVACHVDDEPVCAEHGRSCASCDRRYCSAHEGACSEDGHRACASCLAPCAHCGAEVCTSHAVESAEGAPRGKRRLCARCAVHCEGRRSEPVGRDEAAACATCARFVCERHQGTCEVDGGVHCASHLARTDASRRLVCERDRATCHREPDVVYAADEVHVCPACARHACSAHMSECVSCGRRVCLGEWEQASATCKTCRRLMPHHLPSVVEVGAATEALGERLPKGARWRVARDSVHLVVEINLGWKRRVVFTLRHGEGRAETAMMHSARGRKSLRGPGSGARSPGT